MIPLLNRIRLLTRFGNMILLHVHHIRRIVSPQDRWAWIAQSGVSVLKFVRSSAFDQILHRDSYCEVDAVGGEKEFKSVFVHLSGKDCVDDRSAVS